MKKIIKINSFAILAFLLCSTSVLFFSCKKDSEKKESFHFTCKIDGVFKEFSGYTFAQYDGASPQGGGLGIAGVPQLDGVSGPFSIDIFQTLTGPTPTLEARSYTDTETEFDVVALYNVTGLGPSYQAGTFVKSNADVDGITIDHHFIVTVTEVNDNIIRGHFSGDFYLDGDPNNAKVSITEGDFYVEFK